ncbi:PTS sugar transporter subunit IIA [Acidisphaera sp. S103]|uniref:PTS sugar transporter subunit IIA n=1 Tax=Acidisphaera sp. S103 TaxID=1747223 RepID=UPI00131ECBC0|nr:PTS sugar transporter subunit IIA [Acidisphaera sp. S103]
MEITDFLTADRIVLDVRPRDKAALIGEVARAFARLLPALQPKAVETALLAREQLGSTGLGAGFALPHARIEGLDGYLGLFVRLAKPLDFEAIDGKPVRLVFVLLIPSETTSHVAALAAISRRFRDPDLAARLVKAATPGVAFGLLTER